MSDHKKKLKSAEYVVQISDGVMHGLVSYFATDTSSRQQKSKAYPPFLSLHSVRWRHFLYHCEAETFHEPLA
jgi:hypothetical protein